MPALKKNNQNQTLMSRLYLNIFFLVLIATVSACLIKPPEPPADIWTKTFDFESVTPYEHMLATSTELYLLSRDEFVRIDINKELVERRSMPLPFRFLGRPMLSENVYVRHTRLDNADNQSLEFYLTKNPTAKFVIDLLEFADTTDENLVIDANPRYTGAFNTSGSEFILPTINFSDQERKYVFLLFSIDLNPSSTEFENVTLKKRIEVDEIPAGLFSSDGLLNVKFVNGFYYITSLNGIARIASNGDLTYPIRQVPIFDFFDHQDTIFASGFGNDLHVSLDNGASFIKRDSLTDIQMVEATNEMIFTHQANGFPFRLADPTKMNAREVLRNEDFPNDFAAYKNLVYFHGEYFMTVQKELYHTAEIELVE